MKKFLLGTVALAAMGMAPAFAADLPARTYTKAPPMIAPVLSWTGFYIGGEGGGGWGRDAVDFPAFLTTTGRYDTSGPLAGGVIGYNWQTPGGFVFGVEGSFDWADIKGNALAPSGIHVVNTKLDSLYSGTGRIGYAWNSVLIYAKGGYAYTNTKLDITSIGTGIVTERASSGRDGYVVGAGLEYMFAPNWSAKVEYNYYNFGSKGVTTYSPITGIAVEPATIRSTDLHVVKAGINYHFNWGGPLVARY